MTTNIPVDPNLESVLITDTNGNEVKGVKIAIPGDIFNLRGMYDKAVDLLRHANPDADEDVIHTLAKQFTTPLDFNGINLIDFYPEIDEVDYMDYPEFDK